jgi:hypothetical protein
MNPQFIKDVANIEGNRVHISAMAMPMKSMKTTMSMAIHCLYGYLLQVSGYYVYEKV